MARARNIKPGFFKNEDLAELPYQTRLLFAGLWTLADRDGLLEDRPKKIKIEIFPADDIDVGPCLDQLVKRDFILRYESGGIRCICVKNFRKHQNPHCKEAPSLLPKPSEYDASTVQTPGEHSTRTVQVSDERHVSTVLAPCEPGASPADSLIPDSLIAETVKPLCDESHDVQVKRDGSAGFDGFWRAFGDKRGKSEALKAWKKIKPDSDLALQIIGAAERYAAYRAAVLLPQGQAPKMAQGWLSGERWNDELPAMNYTTEQMEFIAAFNNYIGEAMPSVSASDWTPLRAGKIDAAMAKWDVQKWAQFFAWVRDTCVFDFPATIDWLLIPDNFAKVKDGAFERRAVA